MTTRDQVIKHMITDKYYDNVLTSYLSKKSERDEFRQELWLIILEMPESKLIKYYDGKCLKYVYIGIINNQIKSSSSPWHRKFRMNQPLEYVDNEVVDLNVEINITNKTIAETRLQYIESKLSYLEQKDPYLYRDIAIFRMHYYDKLSYRKIQKLTNISHISVWKYVNNIKFLLKKDISDIKYD